MDNRFVEIKEYKGIDDGEFYYEKLYKMKDKPFIVISSVYWLDDEPPMNPDDNLCYIEDDDIDNMIKIGVKAYNLQQASGTTFDWIEVYDDIDPLQLREYINKVQLKCRDCHYKYTYIQDGILHNARPELLNLSNCDDEYEHGWTRYKNDDGTFNYPEEEGHYAVVYTVDDELHISDMYCEFDDDYPEDEEPLIYWYNYNPRGYGLLEGTENILYYIPLPDRLFV